MISFPSNDKSLQKKSNELVLPSLFVKTCQQIRTSCEYPFSQYKLMCFGDANLIDRDSGGKTTINIKVK